MKFSLLIFVFALQTSFAQEFPTFLQGTWKMDSEDTYERWDLLNENCMKGLMYHMVNGNQFVSEYLEITKKKKKITYAASVVGQNEGKAVYFKMKPTDSATVIVFENPKHDFPKMITYRQLSEKQLFVEVSDGAAEAFSYTMTKLTGAPTKTDSLNQNPNYDQQLAEQFGGDDYGMKGYFLVMLKSGKSDITDEDKINELFRGHMENINRLVEEGKLIVAGPLGKNDRAYRGIFILNGKTKEEIEAMLETDPAIKEGLLDAEIYRWYGSAALAAYLEASDKIWKLKP